MAGLGYKKFTAGSIVSASDVQGYLADQAVQVYASAAARTSALGSAVSAGMVSYRADGTVTEYYNGSSWVALLDTSDYVVNPSYYALNGDRSLSTGTAVQSLYGVGFTLAANTTYEFELLADLAWTSVGANGVSILLNLGASVNAITASATSAYNTSQGQMNAAYSAWQTGTSTISLTPILSAASGTTIYAPVIVKGLVRVGSSTTITPQVSQSSASSTFTLKTGSYMKFNPIGSNIVTTIGAFA
jgi:hypothetical protein